MLDGKAPQSHGSSLPSHQVAQREPRNSGENTVCDCQSSEDLPKT